MNYSVDQIKEILTNLGYNLKDDPKGWRSNAAYRNGDNPLALIIYKDDLTYFDFPQQQSGKVEDLIKIGNGETVNISRQKIEEKEECDEQFDNSLLDDLLPNYSYFNKRGISSETLKLFTGGFCNGGKLGRRYVFPIYDLNNKIIGFSGRSTRNNDDINKYGIARWKHIGRSSSFIYPCHILNKNLDFGQKAILVESIGDCLALYEMGVKNVIVLFGLKISTTIINYLVSKNINDVIISTNNDFESSRGNDAAVKIKNKLDKYFDNVIIKLPPNELKCKDWGDVLLKYPNYETKKYL